MKKSVLIFCTLILGGIFGGIVLLNCVNLFFNPDRPLTSLSENRELAKMPKLSVKTVLNGSYMAATDSFLSDNFVCREELLSVSRKASSYKSITVLLNMDDGLVYIPGVGGDIPDDPDGPKEPDVSLPVNGKDPSDGVSGDDNTPSDTPQDPPFEDNGSSNEPSLPPSPPPPDTGREDEPPKEDEPLSDEPDYSVSGYIIYDGAVYSIAYLVRSVAQQYAETVGRYAELFPDAGVYDITAPLSSIMLTGTKLEKKINSPQKIMSTVSGYFDSEKVTFVDLCDTFTAHKDEYLYFRSDHHWTARGAYYAYSKLSSAMGIDPTPLADMTEKVLTESFRGTMYSMTQSEKVKDYTDVLYAYIPTKKHTMTVTPVSGKTYTRRSSVMTGYKNYSAFIEGDNPLTVIETPDSPQDKVALVIKDSYGDAVVPYLTEIFGKIIVVDPRYYGGNVAEDLAQEGITDIIFINNAYNTSNKSWVKKLNKLIDKR